MSEDLTDKLPKNDSEKLNLILTTMRSLESRVHRVEQQADEKRYDTRPLWEKLQADIADLKESVHSELGGIKSELSGIKTDIGGIKSEIDGIKSEIFGIKSEISEIKRSLRDLSRKQAVVYESVLQIQADLRDMDIRLNILETTHNQQNSQT
jgi:archaellum component FlaC